MTNKLTNKEIEELTVNLWASGFPAIAENFFRDQTGATPTETKEFTKGKVPPGLPIPSTLSKEAALIVLSYCLRAHKPALTKTELVNKVYQLSRAISGQKEKGEAEKIEPADELPPHSAKEPPPAGKLSEKAREAIILHFMETHKHSVGHRLHHNYTGQGVEETEEYMQRVWKGSNPLPELTNGGDALVMATCLWYQGWKYSDAGRYPIFPEDIGELSDEWEKYVSELCESP